MKLSYREIISQEKGDILKIKKLPVHYRESLAKKLMI